MTTLPDAAERFARIHLLRSPNVGPVTYYHLLKRFGSAQAALPAVPDLAARGGARYRLAPRDRIEAEFAAGAHYLFHDDPEYPLMLLAAGTPPPVITVRGNLALFDQPGVAIVGARTASAGAVRLARDFAAGLVERGFAVVSGLARGIDAAAHWGALGVQYGDYARNAAGALETSAEKLSAKDFNDLGVDVKEFVRKSPATALGIAAVTGFLVARLFSRSGDRDA